MIPVVIVEFDPTSYAVNESAGTVRFVIVKIGNRTNDTTVLFNTSDGSATSMDPSFVLCREIIICIEYIITMAFLIVLCREVCCTCRSNRIPYSSNRIPYSMLDNDYSCCISGDDDYGEQNATVTFTPAQTELFVDITINDSVLEGNEDFQGVLSLPSGSAGISLGSRLATATILDDDCKSNKY